MNCWLMPVWSLTLAGVVRACTPVGCRTFSIDRLMNRTAHAGRAAEVGDGERCRQAGDGPKEARGDHWNVRSRGVLLQLGGALLRAGL